MAALAPHVPTVYPPHPNVYVRSISPAVDEPLLRSIFEPYGVVESSKIIPSKVPGGTNYAFVKFSSVEAAHNAIICLNGFQLHGVALEVKLANSPVPPNAAKSGYEKSVEAAIPNDNLYVSHIPTVYSEDRLVVLFQQFGIVLSCKLLTHKATDAAQGYSGMVRMGSVEEASRAVQALNNCQLPEGVQPLAVKFADTPEQKALRKSRVLGSKNPPARYHPYGTPMQPQQQPDYPPANAYAPVQELHFQPVAPATAMQTQIPPYASTGVPPHIPTLSSGAAAAAAPYTQAATRPAPQAAATYSLQSSSIYIKNLPAEADKLYLYETFAALGAIKSVKTMHDVTGLCTGVGFVNFLDPKAAGQAVEAYHGAAVGNQALHVSIQPVKPLGRAGYP